MQIKLIVHNGVSTKYITYDSVVKSPMYAHSWTRLDIGYAASVFGRFQANLGKDLEYILPPY